jgi:MFS family permease
MQTLSSFRSFERPVQVVLANMLANNIGFYMIVPFLAGYMAGDLGLALWVVGLILGIRTLSQQGMSLIGGAIADRIGYKPAIVGGCLFRTAAFVLFGLVDSAVGLTVAAILIGLGGAVMMPAIRSYLSYGAGSRRVEAYALLEMTQHGGSLLGPLVGSLLIGIDFRLVSFAAAVIFLGVGFLQLRYLPTGDAMPAPVPQPILQSWLVPLRNRPFVLLSLSVLGLFFLYNQVYLGLPLEVHRVTGSDGSIGLLFTMLAVVGIFGQVPVTRWADRALRPPVSIALGLLLMGLAFAPLLLTAELVPVPASAVQPWADAAGLSALGGAVALVVSVLPLALCCLLLVLGQMLAVPFVAALIPPLSAGRLLGTYFGMYALVQGIGAAFGNLAGGASLEFAQATGWGGLPWLLMVAVGVACACGVAVLDRSGQLQVSRPRPPVTHAVPGSASSGVPQPAPAAPIHPARG